MFGVTSSRGLGSDLCSGSAATADGLSGPGMATPSGCLSGTSPDPVGVSGQARVEPADGGGDMRTVSDPAPWMRLLPQSGIKFIDMVLPTAELAQARMLFTEHRYDAGLSSERAPHSTPTGVEPPRATQLGLAQQSSSIGHDIAAAATAYWVGAMRQAGRSTRFCRHLGAPQTVLQHMIDEIAIGAARTSVVSTLADAAGRLVADRQTGDFPLGPLAASCSPVIGTYLARLRSMDVPSADSPASMSRSVQLPVADRALTAIAPDRPLGLAEPRLRAGMGVKTTDKPSNFGGDSWARAYAGLVEANIAAVSGLVGTAERDREPGELLSGFASNPFEVAL